MEYPIYLNNRFVNLRNSGEHNIGPQMCILGMKRFDSNSHHSIDYKLQTINRYHF